ncbi:hypothetical protein PLESTM_000779500 [Pleodorina starrii]|nr:generative cell specific-1 paralog [Pleodorina starrii]GLC38808.1 hypothetical protein PLESTM_000779500 [Pleodorina starrii]
MTRAGLFCTGWLAFVRDETGHCLRFNSLWYSAYKLRPASTLTTDISVKLVIPTGAVDNSSEPVTEVLQLNPGRPMAASASRTVTAKLVGDLVKGTQLPDLSNQVLVFPEPDDTTVNKNARADWMVLAMSMFSFDGKDCDKIGTNFTAFRYQENGCYQPNGTCLANQLKDFRDNDLMRLERGLAPLYMVTQCTGGSKAQLKNDTGTLSFEMPVISLSQSNVMLSVSADNVLFTNTNRSSGQESIEDSKVLVATVVDGCMQVCKDIMDVACFVRKGCWDNLGKFVAVLLGIVGGSIVLLFWAFRFCARYSSRRAAATTTAGTYHDSLQQPMPPRPQRMRKSWLVWSNPHSQQYPRDDPILGPLAPQLMSNNPFYNRYG